MTVGIQTVWARWRKWSNRSGWKWLAGYSLLSGGQGKPLWEDDIWAEHPVASWVRRPGEALLRGSGPSLHLMGEVSLEKRGLEQPKRLRWRCWEPACDLCSTRQLRALRSWYLDRHGLKSPLRFKKPHLQRSWILVEEKTPLGQDLKTWSRGLCSRVEVGVSVVIGRQAMAC